jgi:single stranded DNA-binding protein
MAQGPRVYFLGTLTRHPELRYPQNAMAKARCGVAEPTRLRQGDTWHVDVCRLEVVAFGPHAETMGASLRQGRSVLIEGRLQRQRGEQAGQSHCTRAVIIERLQVLSRLRANVPEVAGEARSR